MGELFSSLHGMQVVTLLLAVGMALGFECVNGFHDTANAVATVIYTHSFPPWLAVIWSGIWNFIGVLVSTGAVAFAIVNLLPVDLVTNIGSPVGLSMVFSLLLSALVWNLGTWYMGLPVSSTHSMIGSIMGVGMMNSLLTAHNLIGGLNWHEVQSVMLSLMISPVVGFGCTALLFLALKFVIRNPELYVPADQRKAPPWYIRGVLCLTCTGVSYAHGSNDGQKGLGLLMLILAGIVPGIYALDPSGGPKQLEQLSGYSREASAIIKKHSTDAVPDDKSTAKTLTDYIKDESPFSEKVFAALGVKNDVVSEAFAHADTIAHLDNNQRIVLRADIFLVSKTITKLESDHKFTNGEQGAMTQYRKALDKETKFIPLWAKMAVALALGLGTMVGWKRIVVTIGEKIGKAHLNYGQGASAEMVAMVTIGLASRFGLPVSTTHVLSSGIAGSMAANRSGLQKATLRNIILAWVLTLPACVFLGAMFFGAAILVVLRIFGLH